MECLKTYKTERGIVEIYQDIYPENPRNWDNAVKLHTTKGCPYFDNESSFKTYDDLLEYYGVTQSGYDWDAMIRDARNITEAARKKGDIVKPISVYSHSGDYIYIGTPADHYDGRWDCSLLGFGIIDSETIEKEWNGDYEAAEKCFEGEIKTFSEYVSGDVYGFILKDPETEEELDSCWGFYGRDENENGIADEVGEEIA